MWDQRWLALTRMWLAVDRRLSMGNRRWLVLKPTVVTHWPCCTQVWQFSLCFLHWTSRKPCQSVHDIIKGLNPHHPLFPSACPFAYGSRGMWKHLYLVSINGHAGQQWASFLSDGTLTGFMASLRDFLQFTDKWYVAEVWNEDEVNFVLLTQAAQLQVATVHRFAAIGCLHDAVAPPYIVPYVVACGLHLHVVSLVGRAPSIAPTWPCLGTTAGFLVKRERGAGSRLWRGVSAHSNISFTHWHRFASDEDGACHNIVLDAATHVYLFHVIVFQQVPV